MRSSEEVQGRSRHLLARELDRRVVLAQGRLPHNCRHNYRHSLDVRKEVEGEINEDYNRLDRVALPVIGLCMLDADNPQEWKGNICEDPIDAMRCPYFDMLQTKEAVLEEFNGQIKDLVWVEENMPEVHGLLWALGSESLPKLPWWKALWYRFLKIRPDALGVPPRGLRRLKPLV